MKDDNRQSFWQEQQKKYGFDEREIWSLDYTFVAWIYPRLKMFRERYSNYPDYMTSEQWNNILDKMLDGFKEYLVTDNCWDKKVVIKVNKSLNLFKKYFWDLWW